MACALWGGAVCLCIDWGTLYENTNPKAPNLFFKQFFYCTKMEEKPEIRGVLYPGEYQRRASLQQRTTNKVLACSFAVL